MILYYHVYRPRAARAGGQKGGMGVGAARESVPRSAQVTPARRGARALDLGPRSKDSVTCRVVVVQQHPIG